jgi:colanic acid biosynthesis glycosyl transferase WcaI
VRILLVSQYFWPERFRVNDLVVGWQGRGHEVTVLTGVPNYPTGRLYPGYSHFGPYSERFGCSDIIRVPIITRGRSSRLRLAANYASFVATASTLGALRCRGPFDWVFVYQQSPFTVALPGVLMKRLRGVPMALWIQDLWPESLAAVGAVRSPALLNMVGKLVDWTYRRCDLVLLQSRGFEPAVLSRGVDRARVRYLPNWCEDFYRPVDVGEKLGEGDRLPEGFVFLFAGNLGDAQALGTIVAAAEKLRERKDLHWVFLGEGSCRVELQQEVAARGLEGTVHWLGSKPPEEMPRWFAAADALVVTLGAGPAMELTVPVKVQSYLACAKPILAAIDGETGRVLIDARAGLVGPAENAERLAENALALAAMSGEQLQAMGNRGAEYSRAHFEREMLIDRLDSWLAAPSLDSMPESG